MRTMKRFLLIGVLALLGGAAAWRLAGPAEGADRGPPGLGAAPIPVTAGTAEAKDVPVFVTGLGVVQAYNMVSVKSRVDGQITGLFFKEGQDIAAGARLFQIDPRPFQATLEQAAANKARDEALLAGAQLDLERYGKLLKKEFQTRQSYEDQQAVVGQYKGAVAADQAAIDAARLNLDYADIRAPLSGRTGQRIVDPGNFIQASQGTVLVSIAQLKPIFVSFTVPQDALDAIRRADAKAPLVAVAYGQDAKTVLATGRLSLVDNQVDAATGTIHLKATFDNADERLWPGEFVNMRLITATRKNAVTVPVQTVMQGPNGAYAYVIAPNGTVQRRAVVLTGQQDGLAIIAKGLSAGERVVVDGQYRLIDGSRVRITNPTAGSAPPQAAG